jgi:hypothetical protein
VEADQQRLLRSKNLMTYAYIGNLKEGAEMIRMRTRRRKTNSKTL